MYSLPTAVREHVDFILPAINFDIKTPSPQIHPTNMKRVELGSSVPSNGTNIHLGDPVQELPDPDAGDSCATSVSYILSKRWNEITS